MHTETDLPSALCIRRFHIREVNPLWTRNIWKKRYVVADRYCVRLQPCWACADPLLFPHTAQYDSGLHSVSPVCGVTSMPEGIGSPQADARGPHARPAPFSRGLECPGVQHAQGSHPPRPRGLGDGRGIPSNYSTRE